jgi:hypothetical protein
LLTKKYAGKIDGWWKEDITEWLGDASKVKQAYGIDPPYAVYHGRLGMDHKGRGFDNGPIRTSLVVKESPTQIETLNSIYDLGDPLKVIPH